MKKLLFSIMIISLLFSSLIFANNFNSNIEKKQWRQPKLNQEQKEFFKQGKIASFSNIKGPNKEYKEQFKQEKQKRFNGHKSRKGTPSQIKPKNDKKNKKEFPTFKDKGKFKPSK